jgi:predicted nucleotidyltransferase
MGLHPVEELPASLPDPIRTALAAATEAWRRLLGSRLLSLVLFGSVARGEAREGSDIDLLVVAEGFPRSLRERRRPLLEEWSRVRSEKGLPAVEWNLVTKTPEEAAFHSPLYLDMVEDGILLVDRDGFFRAVLDAMRERMRGLGSRRVFLEDGSWYWDLKPDFRFGEVVEI